MTTSLDQELLHVQNYARKTEDRHNSIHIFFVIPSLTHTHTHTHTHTLYTFLALTLPHPHAPVFHFRCKAERAACAYSHSGNLIYVQSVMALCFIILIWR